MNRPTSLAHNHAGKRFQLACWKYEQNSAKVSFAAILTDDGRLSAKACWNVRTRFDRRLPISSSANPARSRFLAIVGLDDRTHSARADRQGDQLTEAAG